MQTNKTNDVTKNISKTENEKNQAEPTTGASNDRDPINNPNNESWNKNEKKDESEKMYTAKSGQATDVKSGNAEDEDNDEQEVE